MSASLGGLLRSDGEDGGLGELPDEAQFEIRDGKEAEGHDDQSHVVLPKAPGGVIHALLLQVLLPRAAAHTVQRFLNNQSDQMRIKHTETGSLN